MPAMRAEQPGTLRWTKDEYYRFAELGVFDGRRVELIEGEVFEMAAQLAPHAVGVLLVDRALRRVFDDSFSIRVQLPLDFDDSQPEPDFAVVKGEPRDFLGKHPTTALLVVEVAASTLVFDRKSKASVYARAGIADYWIVNLEARTLEVYREPRSNPADSGRFVYASVTVHHATEAVTPLAAPRTLVSVADLQP